MKLYGRRFGASGYRNRLDRLRSIIHPSKQEDTRRVIAKVDGKVVMWIDDQLNSHQTIPTNQAAGALRTARETRRNSPTGTNQLLLFYNNQIVKFDSTNKYLTNPEQLWLIESIVGKQKTQKALAINKTINSQFIESLFKNAPFSFYLSADGAYLVSSDDELTQLDFGPLTKISALAALQRFGLSALERAKEKTVVRL